MCGYVKLAGGGLVKKDITRNWLRCQLYEKAAKKNFLSHLSQRHAALIVGVPRGTLQGWLRGGKPNGWKTYKVATDADLGKVNDVILARRYDAGRHTVWNTRQDYGIPASCRQP